MTTNAFSTLFKKASQIFHPVPKVGGLEITESSIRFLLIEGEQNVLTISSRLAPGVMERGRILDGKAFRAALKDIHGKVAGYRRHALPVVFLLPPSVVFIQPFTLPYLTGSALEEAAKLNLAMLSPIDFKHAYASWQVLSDSSSKSNQIELLGAFVEREVVDAFLAAATETGFSIVAVEFPSLAVTRVITEMGSGIDPHVPHLVLRLTGEGIDMSIIRNANLYFNEFTLWSAMQGTGRGKALAITDVNAFLTQEVQRILNFHMSRWGETLAKFVLITETFEPEIRQVLKDSFSLTVQPIALKVFDRLPGLWYPVLGAAYRGTIPRARDRFVSLTPVSVSTQYHEEQIAWRVGRWRNILVAIAAFFLVLYVGVDSFIARRVVALQTNLVRHGSGVELKQIETLEAQANDFNAFAGLVLHAENASTSFAPILEILRTFAGDRIALKKLDINGAIASLTAVADDETVAVAFKNKLLHDSRFSDVDLPAASIRGNTDGTVTFTASFKTALPP